MSDPKEIKEIYIIVKEHFKDLDKRVWIQKDYFNEEEGFKWFAEEVSKDKDIDFTDTPENIADHIISKLSENLNWSLFTGTSRS